MLQDGNDLDITPVIEYYDGHMPYLSGKGWRSMRCPFHPDKTASARTNGHGFMCHGCGVKGSAIKILMEREGIDFTGAIVKYEEISGRSLEDLRGKATRKRSRKVPFESRDYERGNDLFSAGVRRKRPFSGT